MKNDNEIIKKAKKFITTSSYGKFDYLEELFGRDFLIQQKPRIIFFEILLRLELKTGDINRNSFYSWLGRYRKVPKSKNGGTSKTQCQSKPIKSWEDFQPTDPNIIKREMIVLLSWYRYQAGKWILNPNYALEKGN